MRNRANGYSMGKKISEYEVDEVYQSIDAPTNFKDKSTVETGYLNNFKYKKRLLIKKKFVNWQALVAIFGATSIFVFCHVLLMNGKSVFVVVPMEAVMFVIVWIKMYQIIYDLKLVLFFNNYDSTFDFPSGQRHPTITFIIPSYNEPFEVAKMTFDSIIGIQYSGRKEIVVVDNSRSTNSSDYVQWRNYVENFVSVHTKASVSTKFIHNMRADTLKPGNLDLAEKYIDQGEFVVILDVDSTLPTNAKLLEKAIAEFLIDPCLGFLQFKMKATNSHFNKLTRAVAASQDLHRLRLTGRGFGGFKVFEGHNGMWRRSVLEMVGRWTDYCRGNIVITEDILKSAQVYSSEFYGKSINIETGEWIPSSLNALEGMWMRWTYGTSQVLFKYFKNIYRGKATMIEKFDVSYHVLHHFTQGFILPIIILLQLTLPGVLTNSFLLAVYFLPQVVAATTIFTKSIHKLKLPFLTKIRCLYHGYFLVETFIMSTQLRGSINFLLGVSQGWKTTEKGIERPSNWKNILAGKFFHLILGAGLIASSMISWLFYFDMQFSKLFWVMLPAFIGINLIMCVFTFGQAGRKDHNHISTAVIDAV
jgi:cellulose synthase/poly-beta-1,6-N-acetylglucosamine synthase-like glycosyltransferase